MQLAHHKLILPHKRSRCYLYALFMYLCYVTGTLQNVEKGEKIQWDPDTQGITVNTDSEVGKSNLVWMRFFGDADEPAVGMVFIYFSEPMSYQLGSCTSSKDFTDPLPDDPDKTWTITYMERSVAIHCNGKQVANVPISEAEAGCTESGWSTYWDRKPTRIQFDMSDNASNSYCFSSITGKYNEGFEEA